MRFYAYFLSPLLTTYSTAASIWRSGMWINDGLKTEADFLCRGGGLAKHKARTLHRSNLRSWVIGNHIFAQHGGMPWAIPQLDGLRAYTNINTRFEIGFMHVHYRFLEIRPAIAGIRVINLPVLTTRNDVCQHRLAEFI